MVKGRTIMSAEPRSYMQPAGLHARRKFFEAVKLNPTEIREKHADRTEFHDEPEGILESVVVEAQRWRARRV
jgi:hypothetical protein